MASTSTHPIQKTSGSRYTRLITLAAVLLALLLYMWFRVDGFGGGAAPVAYTQEGLPVAANQADRSPLALVVDASGDQAYVANHTGLSVETVSLRDGRIVRTAALDAAPGGIALDPLSGLLYVTFGLDKGAIQVLQAESGEKVRRFAAGHTPMSPVLSPDGQTLYVVHRFDNEVAAYDVTSGQVLRSLEVTREPIALALSSDGGRLLVGEHLPAQASNSAHVASLVHVVDAASFEVEGSLALPNGSTGLRDAAISPDGRYGYLTHTIGRFGVPTTQLERGWMNTSAVSIIDLETSSLLASVLLDDMDLGAANPWGVGVSHDGSLLVVAHSATHELSVIDRPALHRRIAENNPGHVIHNDLTFLVGIRQRVALPGKGPRGLAMNADKAIVAEYFSNSLATAGSDGVVDQWVLGRPVRPDQVRRGEIAFHDATLCFQQWQSCGSCHPDARVDALNWDLLNDGIGNPKNNRSMLHTHDTPPVMITGIRESAEVAVRAGFRFIQFVEVPEEVAASVDAYLSSLRPVPSPWLENGELSASARRGREVFNKAGCQHCHNGPLYTDGLRYDVGTGPDELGISQFVTPTLSEVWRTAPYLFDGRAETMKEVLTTFNADDRHGKTSTLNTQEVDDLVAYLLSL